MSNPPNLRRILSLAVISATALAGCREDGQRGSPPTAAAGELAVPAQSDWTDYGTVLGAGPAGEWDSQLWGGFAVCALKRSGTYYLYYQGSSGYRETDDTVTWRAIGLATSPDGINFTRHGSGPVLSWLPHRSGEEGAVSCATAIGAQGEIVLFYGANTREGPTTVNADARLASSENGMEFVDRGAVLEHADRAVWGAGDELFPVIAIVEAGLWAVYYIPNGTPQRRLLGVAWGSQPDRLERSGPVRAPNADVGVWGCGSSARIGEGRYALFLNELTVPKLEVRMVSAATPDLVSPPVQTYRFDDFRQGAVLLDEERRTWFLYYRDGESSRYGVKLAPVGERDATAPSAPGGVLATALDAGGVELSWQPAHEPDTGVVHYRVFRHGEHLATVRGSRYHDVAPPEHGGSGYQVSAVNYHGLEGPRSAAVPGEPAEPARR